MSALSADNNPNTEKHLAGAAAVLSQLEERWAEYDAGGRDQTVVGPSDSR